MASKQLNNENKGVAGPKDLSNGVSHFHANLEKLLYNAILNNEFWSQSQFTS